MKPIRHIAGRSNGFSLIELLVAMAIVGILTAIAVPSYTQYVRRGAVEEALANMGSGRVAIEQFFLDNRTYKDGALEAPCPTSTERFDIACEFDASTYTITATGSGNMTGFSYTLTEAGVRTTTSTDWGSGNCWITRKGDSCP
jgi:type IV pilus assembly protein PilE